VSAGEPLVLDPRDDRSKGCRFERTREDGCRSWFQKVGQKLWHPCNQVFEHRGPHVCRCGKHAGKGVSLPEARERVAQ